MLSEILVHSNHFEESISSLERAMALDPASYDTAANRETLEIARSRLNQTTSKAATAKKKIGRRISSAIFRR